VKEFLYIPGSHVMMLFCPLLDQLHSTLGVIVLDVEVTSRDLLTQDISLVRLD